jgi:hypothetical protein
MPMTVCPRRLLASGRPWASTPESGLVADVCVLVSPRSRAAALTEPDVVGLVAAATSPFVALDLSSFAEPSGFAAVADVLSSPCSGSLTAGSIPARDQPGSEGGADQVEVVEMVAGARAAEPAHVEVSGVRADRQGHATPALLRAGASVRATPISARSAAVASVVLA